MPSNQHSQDKLRAERDALLEEKATWSATASGEVPADVSEAQWQSERAELIKARDEASAHSEVSLFAMMTLY